MKSILCFGEALIDFHAQPAADASSPPAYLPHAGGAPANVAVAVAKLGGHAAFAGMLGADAFGDLLLRSLADAGVDMRYVQRTDKANTALAFVSLDASGERSFSFYRPPSADLLFRANHFDERAFADAAIFHVCSNSLTEETIAAVTLEGMTRARAAGALVSFDMNLRPALWPAGENPHPRLWATLEAADLVKLSAEELDFVAAEAGGREHVYQRLWQGRARCLIITDGAAAIHWMTPTHAGRLQPPAVAAVDTTGGGDAFVGGLLYSLAEHHAQPDSLADLIADEGRREAVLGFAAACGALAVGRRGSFAAMPDMAEVRRFLDEHGAAGTAVSAHAS
ncbi:sugar kinase [Rhodanobacter fulvus Jip2]|uniref:Sugar kinase n=1 Tax=Rhodanobacter fulvus Jip2 TaxID=1163408 RepID=I4VRR0_9GAMM|nr:carbohydrate kinase [Rhodanobacter fulvus]EIL89901.1 sugar kinase [Rhodanobacter fulvus Jip2]